MSTATQDATALPEFNPSSDPRVDAIKKAAGDFITAIRDNAPDGWRKERALQEVESAQMFAVKALFAPVRTDGSGTQSAS